MFKVFDFRFPPHLLLVRSNKTNRSYSPGRECTDDNFRAVGVRWSSQLPPRGGEGTYQLGGLVDEEQLLAFSVRLGTLRLQAEKSHSRQLKLEMPERVIGTGCQLGKVTEASASSRVGLESVGGGAPTLESPWRLPG